MDQAADPDFLADFTAALDWWREAGVDCDFFDQPRTWLSRSETQTEEHPAPARRASREQEETAAPLARIDRASLPQDLAAFASWWLDEPLLDDGGLGERIPPCGLAGAKLMIVIEEPEPQDREKLLTGPQGRLLDAMLSAAGIGRDGVYLASALPRHTPAANWSALAERGIGQILAHHVSLVAPERLIVFGGNTLSLLGHESPQRAAVPSQHNQEGQAVPMLACWGLLALLKQPRAKLAWWKAWLEWTAC